MHVHANNEYLGNSKDINLTMLFYLIHIWLQNELFDDFNKIVDIVLKKHRLLRGVMWAGHWKWQAKLVFEKNNIANFLYISFILLFIYFHLEIYTLEYQLILTTCATIPCMGLFEVHQHLNVRIMPKQSANPLKSNIISLPLTVNKATWEKLLVNCP